MLKRKLTVASAAVIAAMTFSPIAFAIDSYSQNEPQRAGAVKAQEPVRPNVSTVLGSWPDFRFANEPDVTGLVWTEKRARPSVERPIVERKLSDSLDNAYFNRGNGGVSAM